MGGDKPPEKECAMATHVPTRAEPTSDRVATSLLVLDGILLILAPFGLGFASSNVAMSNDVILGIAIAVIALITYFWVDARHVWLSWLNALLGLWVLVSPWVLSYVGQATALWTAIVLGIIAIVLGVWAAQQVRSTPAI
jgi:uncharacterized membrane protein HdeD (DUF308 family)